MNKKLIKHPVLTEKAARAEGNGVYTLKVAPTATKISVFHELAVIFEDTSNIKNINMANVRSKKRAIRGGKTMTKRAAYKKAIITLKDPSKPLDLTKIAG